MPKPDPAKFFASPQGAAILKHGILRRHLQAFVSKVGSTSAGHRVVYIDTHAGGGHYDDGTPGSPALAARTASAVANYRNMDLVFVEEDADQLKRLQVALKGTTCEIIDGTVESALDYLIERTAGTPAMWFIDPFGLTLPFDDMVRIMKRPLPTEVILNVGISGIRRSAGLKNPKKLNAMFGDEWWQALWHSDLPRHERDSRMVYGYRSQLGDATHHHNWHVEIADFPKDAPAYYLAHFTQHWDGVWVFMDSVSGAREEQRAWCYQQAGMLDLDSPGHDDRMIAAVKANLTDLVAAGPTRLEQKVNEVYRGVLGDARRKHITKAWDQLVKDGVVKPRPKLGKGQQIQRFIIEPM
jgi:three-Cys-motif partner protein